MSIMVMPSVLAVIMIVLVAMPSFFVIRAIVFVLTYGYTNILEYTAEPALTSGAAVSAVIVAPVWSSAFIVVTFVVMAAPPVSTVSWVTGVVGIAITAPMAVVVSRVGSAVRV